MQSTDSEATLLLVDDEPSVQRLAPALAAHGLQVETASTVAGAVSLARAHAFRYAITALRLPDASGLQLVRALLAIDPAMRVLVFTGYPSIQTAVEAIKLGAVHYLATPVSVDRLIKAMLQDAGNADVAVRDRPMSVHRITWEHIHHVLHENQGNISATARALSIDRRTLQRKLRKRPVAE